MSYAAAAAAKQPSSQPPTVRVPGASLAAAAEAEGAKGRGASLRGASGGGGGKGRDGFQPVRNGIPANATRQGPAAHRPTRTSNSWAELTEAEDAMCDVDVEGAADDSLPELSGCEEEAGEEGDGHADADDDEGGDDGGDEEPAKSEQELRQEWLDHCRACKALERDPSAPASLVASARTLRDDAERRWREAKTPHPLSKRLRWAEADLHAAEEKEAAHRSELALHLEEASRRTRELESRIAVDVARTSRKRELLRSLLAESVPGNAAQGERAAAAVAATAVTGIKDSIAPPLAAAIERLSAPIDEGAAEGIKQELQLVAASLGSLEGLLRGSITPSVPIGSALHYDIGGGDDDGDGRADGGGASVGNDGAWDGAAEGATARTTATTTRWTKPAASEPWRKTTAGGTAAAPPTDSMSAAKEARRLLRERGGVAGSAAAEQPSGTRSAAETNDLAEAAKRSHQAAQLQFQQSQAQRLRRHDDQVAQQEELDRQRRQQQQEEEKRAHMQAFERAAADRRAEEARQRELLVASMSPEDLARAAEAHAQHLAVGAQAFGSQAASCLAGMVHQEHAQALAHGGNAQGMVADPETLIAMSPEELAQWDREHQAGAGSVPW